ncbi:mCG146511, partial [Mus musculus]
ERQQCRHAGFGDGDELGVST